MRLALLAGGSPERSISCAISRLIAGKYQIHIEGLRDSELTLNVGGVHFQSLTPNGAMFIDKANDVQVQWKKRGTEKSITVIAERVS